MQGTERPSLEECLVSIAEDESPPLNGTLEVAYIVLRRVNLRKSHFYVEFVDGDKRDGFEWFEGPFPAYMTLGALFEFREERTREERREMNGRERLGEGKTRPEPKRALRAGEERTTEACDNEHAADSSSCGERRDSADTRNGPSRDSADTRNGPSRDSADTGNGPSRAMSAKMAKHSYR
jgi:hypothetical protein